MIEAAGKSKAPPRAVLVVDDEEPILNVCSRILKSKNYDTDLSVSVDEALKKLGKKKYDLVISDLTLPGKSGFELLKEVKKNYPGTGVIIMTGHAEIESAVECMKNGADDYLPKPLEPFEMKGLLDTTGRFFETKRLREEVLKLRNTDELKSKFLANVTHELRTPLTAIKSAADLCVRLGEGGSSTKKLIDIIKNNSERMLVLVNDLLDVAEIERNEIVLKKTKTDIVRCVENAIHSIKSKAEEKNIAIEFRRKTAAEIFGDRIRMEEIFINLLDNAVKFSPEGSSIEIGVFRAGGNVEIVFSDEGPGIIKKERTKVFDKFYQTGTSLAHKNKGFGIGLSIVRELTEMHGGSVEAFPRKHKGVKFVVTLPLSGKKEIRE